MHIVMTVIAVRVQENYNDLRGSKWHKKKGKTWSKAKSVLSEKSVILIAS